MYGQKQIIQCMAVIFMVSILNFYRSIIQQNKEMERNRFKRLEAIRIKDLETIRLTESIQFFLAIHKVNFELEFCCGYEILDFEYSHLINEQCSVNSCLWNDTSEIKTFEQSLTSIANTEENLSCESNTDDNTVRIEDFLDQTEQNIFLDDNSMSELLTLENIKANYLKEDSRNHPDRVTGINYGKYIFNAVGLIMVSIGLWKAIVNCWKKVLNDESNIQQATESAKIKMK